MTHEIINEVETPESITSTCVCGWTTRTHLARGHEDFALGMHDSSVEDHLNVA